MLHKLADTELEEGRDTRFGRALLMELRSRDQEYRTYLTRTAGTGCEAKALGHMCALGGKALLCEELIELIERKEQE